MSSPRGILWAHSLRRTSSRITASAILNVMPTWNDIVAANPDHSHRYAKRWDIFVAQGRDIDGEARLIDALAQRGSRMLDAGAGTGRVGAYLLKKGHSVTGVDVDPYLVSVAQNRLPDGDWHVADLGDESPAPHDFPEGPFDIIYSAGNVFPFIAPDHRATAVANLSNRLADGGRMVLGFALDRGYTAQQFLADAEAAGLTPQDMFSSWNADPYDETSTFLVAVLTRA